jgi:hypothetical protein
MAPDPPVPGTLAELGEMDSVPPASVTGTVTGDAPCPGVTVIVAVRETADGFAFTVYWTEPLPVPLLPVSVTTLVSLLTAFHVSVEIDAFT